jgi:hypothetical protein
MLSSYPVACPHANCGWAGNLVPSLLRGGPNAEIVSMHRAWFRCPRCQDDWEVRITNDRVTVLPVVERDIPFQKGVSSKSYQAVAFDVDAVSLASLREALPGWEIDTSNGAIPASLAHNWDPGAVDLLVVSASGDVKQILGLCRFLSFSTWYSTASREEVAAALGPRENLPALRPDTPVLVLVPAGREPLVGSALEADARSCLVLPMHPKEVAGMLARARAGNQPGRHTLSLDQAQIEDRWRDGGDQG